MHPGEKRAVLVLGMHRSGTSAVAGAAHLLGAEPPKFMIPAAADNPSGFFEAITVLGVNDWILKAGGSTWFDCLNFDPDSLPPRSRDTGQALVNFSLIGEFENASLLLLKDPRLCLLLDYWLPVLRGTSITPAALLVLRDPHEVVASLMQRDHCPAAFTAALWLRYMFAAEHATRDCSRSFIRYDALLGDWRTCMARAAAQAGVQWRALSMRSRRRCSGSSTSDCGIIAARRCPPAPPGSSRRLDGRGLSSVACDRGGRRRRTARRLDGLRATFTAWCRRDGASFAARALEGHELLRQPAQAIPAGWEELAETLALKTRGQPGPV